MKRTNRRCGDRVQFVDGLYITPDYATVELLKKEKFTGTVWEPCCGRGNIAKFFKGCYASDIREEKFIFGDKGIDFLKQNHKKFDNIVTNPPYGLANEIVEHAVSLANKKVAVLLRLLFLESQKRNFLFKKDFKCVYVFRKRISCIPESPDKKIRRAMAFAWFIWDKDYTGKPYIDWI